jgi:negative regulator of flagellin synthesis FlgM
MESVMEIKNTLTPLDAYRAKLEKAEKDSPRASEKNAAPASPGDKISLSPEARLRTEIYRAAMSVPEVRQARVDAVKAKIEAGTYQIDSRSVAKKLLAEEPGLFKA